MRFGSRWRGGEGGDARDLIDAMRPDTQAVWKALGRRDQERFLASLMRVWTVHRSRMPPVVAEWVDALRAGGRLVILAGRLVRVDPGPADGLTVAIDLPSGATDALGVAAVVNCAGPADSPFGGSSPLYHDLLTQGLARPHPLGLGVDTGDQWRRSPPRRRALGLDLRRRLAAPGRAVGVGGDPGDPRPGGRARPEARDG